MDGTEGAAVTNAANGISSQASTAITGTAVDTDSSMKYVKGRVAQGINFDGTEDHIVLQNHAALDVTGTELSLMAWIKLSDTCCANGYSRIISKRTDATGNDVYMLAVHDFASQVVFRINGSTSTGGVLTRNTWHHVAGIYDGTNRKIYINGELALTSLSQTEAINSSSRPVHIGKREGEDRLFDGNMDEVAIFGRALSATEVRDIYLRGKNQLKYQVRSCDDAACSGESFLGPDGSSSTFYSEASNFNAAASEFDISHLTNNRYIQFKTVMDEVDGTNPPKILSIDFTGNK